MTCPHVLGLIDAGTFADYPRAHLAAAWQHARQCATCGPALQVASALAADLAVLPAPSPPPHLTAAVLGRIAQIESQVTVPQAAAVLEPGGHADVRDWSAWATTLGGLAVGLALVLSMPSVNEVLIAIATPRLGGMTAGPGTLPSMTPWTFVLVAGLVIYVSGLFAPVRRRTQAHRESE